MNFIALFTKQFLSDEEDESDSIVSRYKNASKNEREVLDRVFVNLCGWTVATLINRSNHDEYFEEDGMGFKTEEQNVKPPYET